MSGRITSIQGQLKPSANRRQRAAPVETSTEIEAARPSVSPEIDVIRQIPGIQPFLTPDLILDVIFIFQYEGAKAYIDSLTTKPIDKNLMDVMINWPWDHFLNVLSEFTKVGIPELTNIMYRYGMERLANLLTLRDPSRDGHLLFDPENPSSLIFNHPSQEKNAADLEVEKDIIRNEPDVADHATEQCHECKSKRIRLVSVQTRSADEPPTIFAECVNCRKKWKFGAA